MSSSSKPNREKNTIRNTLVVKLGCGCRRPKLANVFSPKPKSKASSDHHHHCRNSDIPVSSSSTSSWDRTGGEDDTTTTTTTTATSLSAQYLDTTPLSHSEREEAHCKDTQIATTMNCSEDSKTVKGFGRIGESLAVVKESDDPYLDFRQSMLQMILEKQIYSKEDLKDLLDCFLQLNSPYHHEIIVQAFSEIWNSVFSVLKPAAGSSSSSVQTLPPLEQP